MVFQITFTSFRVESKIKNKNYCICIQTVYTGLVEVSACLTTNEEVASSIPGTREDICVATLLNSSRSD